MAMIHKLMIRCPATGKLLDSGIRTSGRETLNGGLLQGGRVNCRHCHQLHSMERHGFFDMDPAAAGTGLWRPNR